MHSEKESYVTVAVLVFSVGSVLIPVLNKAKDQTRRLTS